MQCYQLANKQRVQPLTEPIAGSIINQSQRNPTQQQQPQRLPPPSTGSNSAILALTFSTLLSSQRSDTPRTRTKIPAWGNSTNTSSCSVRSQILASLELHGPRSTRSVS